MKKEIVDQRTHYHMPAWIWGIPRTWLSDQDKQFLKLIWWMGFQTCHCHNHWFQKKYGYSRRMVQLRIAKLKRLRLISIGCPNSHMRTLYPRRHMNAAAWLAAMCRLKMVPQPFTTKKICH